MREGEILGLKWSCVDFDSGTILIDKQLRKDQKKAEKLGPVWVDSDLVFTNPMGDRLSYRTA